MTLALVPDIPNGLTPSAARIYAAVVTSPGSTAAELASTTSAGRSTAGKLLRQMEETGLVRRVPGGSDGNRHYPDRWYLPAASPSDTDEPGDSPSNAVGSDAPVDADAQASDDEPSVPRAADDASGPAHPKDTLEEPTDCGDRQSPTPAADRAAKTMPGSPGEAPPTGRLGQGGLRALVHGYLTDHPDSAHSPTKISRQLGRSSGAVANALVTLANAGQAELVTTKPRTYQLVPPPAQPK